MILRRRQLSTELQLLIVSSLTNWLQTNHVPAEQPSETGFPGVVLLEQGMVVLAFGFSVDAAGHCTATVPICARPGDQRNAVFASLGYSELAAFADSSRFKSLRCLVDMGIDSKCRELLTASSWKQVATIIRWSLTVSASASPPDKDALRYSVREIDPHEGSVQDLLQDILCTSDDLPLEIRPDPQELVLNWDALPHGYQTLGVYDLSSKELAGLLVYSAPGQSRQLNPCQQTNIEYIGVGSRFRQRGLARRLMSTVKRQLPSGSLITAYADASNYPAHQLYRNCGFIQEGCWLLLKWEY